MNVSVENACAVNQEVPDEIDWTMKVYNNGQAVRNYYRLPHWLPLNAGIAHGLTTSDFIPEYELNSTAKIQVYFSEWRVNLFRKVSKRPVLCVRPPAILHRIKNRIKQKTDAAGTVAFPAHTTPDIDDEMSIEEYAENLNALPERFKPITVCLHWNDINKGMHHKYERLGFKVVSAGHSYDKDFLNKMYYILSGHKFATSNDYGSVLFYALDLGLPFFIYGPKAVYINKNDPYIEKGLYQSYRNARYTEIVNEFRGIFDTVNEKHKFIFERETGLNKTDHFMKVSAYFWFYGIKVLIKNALKR